jgi:hypothetical protein
MSKGSPEILLSSIYELWEYCTEEEKDEVTRIDDKLTAKGSLGPHEIRKDLRHRRDSA